MKSLAKILVLGVAGAVLWRLLPKYRLGLALVALFGLGYVFSEGRVW